MAKRLFAVCLAKADSKEPADGKECLCHLPLLCRLADGKEFFAVCQQTAKKWQMANTLFAISWFFAVCFDKTDGKQPLCHQLADGKELTDGKDPDSSSESNSL